MLVKKLLKLKFVHLFFILIIISFLIGYYTFECNYSIKKEILESITLQEKFILFKKVLLKNLGFAFLLSLGFMFYNISTFVLLFYNGLMCGIFFKKNNCELDFTKTITLVSSHLFLEIIWIFYFSLFSYYLSKDFMTLLNKEISYEKTIPIINKKMNLIIRGTIILITSAIIESFFSIEIYKLLT